MHEKIYVGVGIEKTNVTRAHEKQEGGECGYYFLIGSIVGALSGFLCWGI